MPTVFVISLALLCLLLVFRYVELVRGRRFAAGVRSRMDMATVGAVRRGKRAVRRIGEYVRRDVVLRTLHIVTYVSLVLVRYIERKLTYMTEFLRSFRKKRGVRATSEGLGKIRRGEE